MSAILVDFKPAFPKQEKEKSVKWLKPKEIAAYFRTSTATVSKWGTREVDPLPRKKIGKQQGASVLIDLETAKIWHDRNFGKGV